MGLFSTKDKEPEWFEAFEADDGISWKSLKKWNLPELMEGDETPQFGIILSFGLTVDYALRIEQETKTGDGKVIEKWGTTKTGIIVTNKAVYFVHTMNQYRVPYNAINGAMYTGNSIIVDEAGVQFPKSGARFKAVLSNDNGRPNGLEKKAVEYISQKAGTTDNQSNVDSQNGTEQTSEKGNIKEEISDLHDLMQEGIISEDEFEEKKDELLDRI